MSSVLVTPPSAALPRRLEPRFVRAKFRPPRPPRHFVPRLRLLTLVDDLTEEYPVTAVVAPAGAGKTVSAADWLRRRQGANAWLTLAPADRDVAELWHSLTTAVDLVRGTPTDPRGQQLPDEKLFEMLERLPPPAGSSAPSVLVVDEVSRLQDDDATHALLAAFVEHRPPWLRLLLLSRRRPPLPVDRLRASGELADLDFGALRFSHEEACSLLTQVCPDLPAADVDAAADRADGWAAALQLTALAIRSHPYATGPRSFTSEHPGPERLVDEYLWEEVLRVERPELVGLLLATSVVGRVNHVLAEVLTQRSDAGDLLEEAGSAGLFMTAREGGWFEMHSMVRQVLCTRFRRRSPETFRTHHARAAQWYEDLGDGSASLEHWLSAERSADALRVLSDLVLPLVEAGDLARVHEAIVQIPTQEVSADPINAIRYAWCHVAAGPHAFVDTLSLADTATADAAEPSRARMETLRAVTSWLGGDWLGASDQARQALNEADRTAASDPVDRFGWRMVSGGIALDERWDDRERIVGDARAACLEDPSARWSFEGTRALGLALAGRPLESLRVAEDVREMAATGLYESLRIELALADAVVARELDDREEGALAALQDLVGTPTYPDPVLQVIAQLELARQRTSAGDLEAATAQLEMADALHARLASSVPDGATQAATRSDSLSSSPVARVGVDVALASDDPATAARWSAQVLDPFWGAACEAKVHLAHRRPDEAEQAARKARPRCPRHEVVRDLLLARALVKQDRSAAEEAVADAVGIAARHGMLATVASEGAPVMDLVELAAWRVPDTWMDRLRRVLVPVWTSPGAQRPIDDLTDRELDVLRLLPSRLTLTEIASELYVSQNTVKFHVRAIYRKLAAVSRAEAVEAARQMRLLPRGG